MRKLFAIFSIPGILMGISCDPIDPPVVLTVSSDVVNVNLVILTGEVVDEGGSAVTNRGFYWSTSPNPDSTDYYSENQSGLGVFMETVKNLFIGKKYYYRSYADNAEGKHLGEIKSFRIEVISSTGSIVDSRNARNYPTVAIKNQNWLSCNLSYIPAVSPSRRGSETSPHYYVYNYEGNTPSAASGTDNYLIYGVLYNWEAARTACPKGWHLPSDSEWDTLITYLGYYPADLMKETGTDLWSGDNARATNASGFNVRPGGFRRYFSDFASSFYSINQEAFFWSSSENGPLDASALSLSYTSSNVARYVYFKSNGLSVRCLQDTL